MSALPVLLVSQTIPKMASTPRVPIWDQVLCSVETVFIFLFAWFNLLILYFFYQICVLLVCLFLFICYILTF